MKKLLLISLLVITSCATVTADTDQKITVTTHPAGAHCTLTNGEGSWEIAKTPDSAMVKRAFSKLHIYCEKAGAGDGDLTIEAETRNRAFGNILLFGVPTVVDVATGDGYQYEHDDVVILLSK